MFEIEKFDNQPHLFLNADEAAKALSMSRSSFLRADRTGQIGPKRVKIGRLVRWSSEELAAWVRHGAPPRVQWLQEWKRIRDGRG